MNFVAVAKHLNISVLRLLESHTNKILVRKLGVPTKFSQLLILSSKDFDFRSNIIYYPH